MKTTFAAVIAAAASVSAHSWIECVQHEDTEIRQWMEGNSTLSPPVLVDPAMPWFADFCKGWPRGKANPGNWIDESTNLVWNIEDKAFVGDTNACNPNQRGPNQLAGAPMAEVPAGGTVNLRYGGNGHARGSGCNNFDCGTVNVYWKATPEAEFTDISEFTQANLLASAGFSDDSFSYPADPNIKTPNEGLFDKGNWFKFGIPAGTATGRYVFAWVWHYNDKDKWSSCFDIQVTGGGAAASVPQVESQSQDKPVVEEAAAPAPTPAPTPAEQYNNNKPAVVVETEWSTVTQYVKNKRVHARNF